MSPEISLVSLSYVSSGRKGLCWPWTEAERPASIESRAKNRRICPPAGSRFQVSGSRKTHASEAGTRNLEPETCLLTSAEPRPVAVLGDERFEQSFRTALVVL